MNKRKRRLLVGYAVALPFFMVGLNYLRARNHGDSPGLAALVSGIVVALLLGLAAWALYDAKRKGRQIGLDNFGDGRHPGEGHQPQGWRWDDKSKRWRKPPRPGH